VTSKPDFKVMVLLLVFMQLTRDLFAIAKFLYCWVTSAVGAHSQPAISFDIFTELQEILSPTLLRSAEWYIGCLSITWLYVYDIDLRSSNCMDKFSICDTFWLHQFEDELPSIHHLQYISCCFMRPGDLGLWPLELEMLASYFCYGQPM